MSHLVLSSRPRLAAEQSNQKGKFHARSGRRDYRDADAFGFRQSGIRRESRPNVLSRRRFMQGRRVLQLPRQDGETHKYAFREVGGPINACAIDMQAYPRF